MHSHGEDLLRLGVKPGSVLMVHTSLRSLGQIENRAARIIEALQETIGPTGAMMMVLGAQNEWDWVNTHPEHERAALLQGAIWRKPR